MVATRRVSGLSPVCGGVFSAVLNPSWTRGVECNGNAVGFDRIVNMKSVGVIELGRQATKLLCQTWKVSRETTRCLAFCGDFLTR